MSGPLEGIRIIELAGLGPAPFAGMMLADAGADIIRIDRSNRAIYPPIQEPHVDLLNRGRRSVAVDLKHPDGVALVLRLVEGADGFMEGFRPGVAERLGLGPDECLARNPALAYGRMTGYGQDGPMAQAAGHDIDYIALSGALEAMGRAGERPVPPLNLVGDFGGGGMLLAYGMLAAILGARTTGKGQVIDAAMVDGAASLMTMTYTLRSAGIWQDARGTNMLDTGAHFYEVYETSDGGFMGVGAIEPQFYAELMQLLGLGDEDRSNQMDRSSPAPTPAWRRCCRPPRRLSTPTTRSGARSPRWPAWSSRHRPRGSCRRRARSGGHRPTLASAATRRWPTGDCRATR